MFCGRFASLHEDSVGLFWYQDGRWGCFVVILDHLWGRSVVILGSFWHRFRIILGLFSCRFNHISRPFGGHFSLGDFWAIFTVILQFLVMFWEVDCKIKQNDPREEKNMQNSAEIHQNDAKLC